MRSKALIPQLPTANGQLQFSQYQSKTANSVPGNYKVTIKQALDVKEYPLPTPEELFVSLAGGKLFSKLDLSQAYIQVFMDEASTDYLTINAHQSLYVYNCLPFGVTSAPVIFQKLMDTVLQGINGITRYIDDILVSSASEETHFKILDVFARLEKHRFSLKLEYKRNIQLTFDILLA